MATLLKVEWQVKEVKITIKRVHKKTLTIFLIFIVDNFKDIIEVGNFRLFPMATLLKWQVKEARITT